MKHIPESTLKYLTIQRWIGANKKEESLADVIYEVTNGQIAVWEYLSYGQKMDVHNHVIRETEEEYKKVEKLRRAVYYRGYQIGWHWTETKKWCEYHGIFGQKKNFYSYSPRDLVGLCEVLRKIENNYNKESYGTVACG